MTAKRRILLAEITPGIPQPQVFATWNPSDKHADIALSGGNLIAEKSMTDAVQWACVRGTESMAVGQWYWETKVEFTGTADIECGIAISTRPLTVAPGAFVSLSFAVGVNLAGDIRIGGSTVGTIGAVASGSVIRHWLDLDAGTYSVANAGGAWVEASSSAAFVLFPIVGILRPSLATASCTANFGASPFVYEAPDGTNAGIYSAPSTPTTVYLGSEGLHAVIDETPVHFMGRIAGDQDVEVEREASCWVWGGQSLSRRGQLVVINNDGALDAWREYLWRDAAVILLAGWAGDAYEDFEPWAFARIDTIELTRDSRIVLTFADPVAWFDRQLQDALYPADQANLQLAGKPEPIVYGAPLYCTPAQLSTNPTERDYQLHDDTGATALIEIDPVFDSGDQFAGPDDPFTPHDAVTAANGGNFGGWTGVPAYPANWEQPAGAGEFGPNDKFADESSGFMRCISLHAPRVEMQHTADTMQADRRYQISFNCTAVHAAGALYFRVAGSPEVAVSLTSTGAKSVDLYVKAAGQLRIGMKGDGINVIIRELRASAVQVIDWTYWGTTRGFTLTNTPYGKVVANPSNDTSTLTAIVEDVAARTAIPDITIDGVPYNAIDMDTVDVADPASPQRELAAYVDKPTTGLELLKDALNSFCGFVVSNRLGQVAFGRIKEPGRSSEALTLDTSNVLGEIIVTTDVAKNLTVRLAGGKNNTVHTAAEIVSGVSDELATELQTEYRYTVDGATAASAPVSSAYAAAIAAPAQGTMLQSQAALQAEANRVATLWRPTRNFYLLTAILDPDAADSDALEPGQTVRLVWPRWGLESGKNLLVIGVKTRFFSRRVQLKLWG